MPPRSRSRHPVDATRAADAAQDFPIDATVAHSTWQAMRELVADTRVVPLRLAPVHALTLREPRREEPAWR